MPTTIKAKKAKAKRLRNAKGQFITRGTGTAKAPTDHAPRKSAPKGLVSAKQHPKLSTRLKRAGRKVSSTFGRGKKMGAALMGRGHL